MHDIIMNSIEICLIINKHALIASRIRRSKEKQKPQSNSTVKFHCHTSSWLDTNITALKCNTYREKKCNLASS